MIKTDEPMSLHTSWRVGGPADIFFEPENTEALANYLKSLSNGTPVFWCGLGSNLLVRDGGIRGVVIGSQRFLNKIEMLDAQTVRAEAGVSCATLARFSARQHLMGIEFLAGVPGTVGGALAMNAGCHGGETWPQIKDVEMINRDGEIQMIPAERFAYGYRHVEVPKNHWFLAAHFQLMKGEKEKSLQTIRELLDYRSRTQPTNEPSCGSTFRNPPGTYAAKLIEEVGLKGYKMGGAMVSPKHANFIVNLGSATAADIEALIAHIQRVVKEKTDVDLILEVRIVGESSRI